MFIHIHTHVALCVCFGTFVCSLCVRVLGLRDG